MQQYAAGVFMKAKISAKEFYNAVYAQIGSLTPINADCGRLCGGKCCEVTEEITGMYLFPFENAMYENMPQWGEIYDTDFSYGDEKYIDLFTCDGTCERDKRPLSCRIFPLAPYKKRGGKLEIIMDPRGKGLCPLASVMKIEDLDKEFVSAVRKAMLLCLKEENCREFIYSLTESFDSAEDII